MTSRRERACAQLAVVALCVLSLCASVRGDEHTKTYVDGEDMILWANKVGPYANSFETYGYFVLPFCRGSEIIEHKHETLGERLLGYELVNSGIGLRFLEEIPPKEICTSKIGETEANAFIYAIKEHYWYQFFLDDLPIWGMVGEVVEGDDGSETAYIYTHKSFSISRNGDQVIEVNMTSENPKPVEAGSDITFTYSVAWTTSTTPFDKRWEKFLDFNFFEHQIHWFSIFNSFMMVIFLVGIVAMILIRTLRQDYKKYDVDEDADEFDREIEDSGWKQVHGDVFRAPPNLVCFSALVGTGFQLTVLVAFVIVIAILGTVYESRGTLLTISIFAYALTSVAGGFYSGGYYAQNKGKAWKKTMVLTAALFPGAAFGIAFMLNFIAMSYHSLAAIPFMSMLTMVLIWSFIAFPLTLLGTFLGRSLNSDLNEPCRVRRLPRPIPDKKWYMEPIMIIGLGGVLPFGSIFIELYFVFTSFWHYKFYYVYGFLLLVFVILLIVSVCVTVVSTYFLLNSEDYRWQWMSFLSAASTAGYVYLYSIYYFVVKTAMSGFFQTAFYFGYMAMFCVGFAILCGTVGFIGASTFVHRIYRNIKVD